MLRTCRYCQQGPIFIAYIRVLCVAKRLPVHVQLVPHLPARYIRLLAFSCITSMMIDDKVMSMTAMLPGLTHFMRIQDGDVIFFKFNVTSTGKK